MTNNWQQCKNILIIRADNMGDLVMSAPAIRALKETFLARITVLTSSMAAGIAPFLPEIDDTIVFDLPWIKAKETIGSDEIFTLVQQLKERSFDAVVIFTVFSQNPLPAAMIAYMANIPLRLAFCRENPYALLTDWVPDKEPYSFIKHQVERDLQLVESVGATTKNTGLHLEIADSVKQQVKDLLVECGVDLAKQWIIFHAGVSEKKREYPSHLWVEAAKKLIEQKGLQILFTGAKSEKTLCNALAKETGSGSFSVAGVFTIEQFISLIGQASVVVSVNTGTVHIAAAMNTPVVVLYAQTNPQHTPWKVSCKVLEYGIEPESRSKNEVISYLYKEVYTTNAALPNTAEIISAVEELMSDRS